MNNFKLVPLTSLILTALALPAHAEQDPLTTLELDARFLEQALTSKYFQITQGEKDGCVKALAEIKAGGAKLVHSDSWGSSFRAFGGVEATKGVDLTFENAEKMCAKYERYWIRDHHGKELLGIAAFLATTVKDSVEAAKATAETGDRCAKLVDEIVAAGFPGSMPIELSAGGKQLTKTLDDVKPKVCDVQRAKGQAVLTELEAVEGPYRKVLKADKLDMALSRKQTQFFGVGGKPLATPAQMAASKVWFIHSWSEEDSCRSNGAPVHTLRRFAYDAKHLLVSETSKTFCGAPPKSGYR
jgi:hypothetical protein